VLTRSTFSGSEFLTHAVSINSLKSMKTECSTSILPDLVNGGLLSLAWNSLSTQTAPLTTLSSGDVKKHSKKQAHSRSARYVIPTDLQPEDPAAHQARSGQRQGLRARLHAPCLFVFCNELPRIIVDQSHNHQAACPCQPGRFLAQNSYERMDNVLLLNPCSWGTLVLAFCIVATVLHRECPL
jgi:hypothetical protein